MRKEIILIYRKQFPNTFSIEFIFNQLYDFSQADHSIKKYVLPKFSNSTFNRVANILAMLRLRHKIVHVSGDVHYAILGAWFNMRILTIHDLAFMHQHLGVKRSILKWFYIVLPVKFAHRVTVVSEATKADLLRYVPIEAEKIKVIPDFISPVFQPFLDRKFNTGQIRILQIGTAFNKNIDRLAEALSGISCTLIIIGELDTIQIAQLNKFKISFVSKVNLSEKELLLEYKKADLLTSVSTIEGFGMPILEAQATGLPVITSNCSSMPEIAGDAAVLVNPLEITSIRDGVLSVINDETLRNVLVQKGLENVKRFSRGKIMAQYTSLYLELDRKL